MAELSNTVAKRAARNRWLLLTPALIILIFAASGPLLITLFYSFLTPGDYGGVVWNFSTDAWFGVLMQRDIFDDTLDEPADPHLRHSGIDPQRRHCEFHPHRAWHH